MYIILNLRAKRARKKWELFQIEIVFFIHTKQFQMKIVFAIPKLQFPFRIVSNEVRGKCGYNFYIEIEILQSEKVTTQRGGIINLYPRYRYSTPISIKKKR